MYREREMMSESLGTWAALAPAQTPMFPVGLKAAFRVAGAREELGWLARWGYVATEYVWWY